MMPIASLSFTNVGPFDEVDFAFDPQVNIFTGPNNSGKSSVLWVLGEVTVFPFGLPNKLLRKGTDPAFEFHMRGDCDETINGNLPIRMGLSAGQDGDANYWSAELWSKYVKILGMIGFSKFIPALRWSTDYRSSGPTVPQREDVDKKPTDWARDIVRSDLDPEFKRRLALVSEKPLLNQRRNRYPKNYRPGLPILLEAKARTPEHNRQDRGNGFPNC